MGNERYTVALDFDGVLHLYEKGWQGATVLEGPTEGAQEAVAALFDMGYEVAVFSTRAETPEGAAAIRSWLVEHGFPSADKIPVSATKPKAVLFVDDRGFRFEGDWHSILAVAGRGKEACEPWNRKKGDEDFMKQMRAAGEVPEKITAEVIARCHDRFAAFLREPVPEKYNDVLKAMDDYVDWRCRTG